MINQVLLNKWVSTYRSVYESERKPGVDMTIQSAAAFQQAWNEWATAPADISLLYACIDAIKSAGDVFCGIYNHTHVFGGKRGKHNYGMLGFMAADLPGEQPGTGARCVYDMFNALYAEGEIHNRYNNFAAIAEDRVDKFRTLGRLQPTSGHLQSIHPASVYCWLKEPARYYYFFTNDYVKLCAAAIGASEVGGRKAFFLENAYAFMAELSEAFLKEWGESVNKIELSALVSDFVTFVAVSERQVKNSPQHSQCWLLVAKPSHWSFASLAEGEEVSYSLYNEDGNKRQIFKNFTDARVGDKVACYESSPVSSLVALAEVSEEQNGECIRFRKIKNIAEPVPLQTLKNHPLVGERFSHMQGSLFDMTHEQYDTIVRMADQTVRWHAKRNRIKFGAPGTGKSHQLNRDALTYFDEAHMERVTFHPEYTSFDFVGSYMPTVQNRGTSDERISYGYVPGPFARVLKQALKNPDTPYLLLIEEINRANAASVFADIFQLLDRAENGASTYFITPSPHLADYLGMAEHAPLRLPHNLYIWATMNSADQGVFPMDTAFKRRWNFEYCGIDDAQNELRSIGNYAHDWDRLRCHVNKLLQHAGVNEDKQMGPFFLSASELKDEESFIEAIKSKVIMYLFEDAARHKRGAVFKNARARYSELCGFMGADIDELIDELFLEPTES